MQELEQQNTNRNITLLKIFQSFLENVCFHWIKTNSSPPLLLDDLCFREINNTCQSKMFPQPGGIPWQKGVQEPGFPAP